jgi:RND superfamily putative drug exporter
VFLMSRIKEEHSRGADNVRAVARGLQRTGGIVTAAALAMSVVFLSFATSGVALIKLFGLGVTLAVLMDAAVIRPLLVPAFMRLAGPANWWAPGPLRAFHRRFGWVDGEDEVRWEELPPTKISRPTPAHHRVNGLRKPSTRHRTSHAGASNADEQPGQRSRFAEGLGDPTLLSAGAHTMINGATGSSELRNEGVVTQPV